MAASQKLSPGGRTGAVSVAELLQAALAAGALKVARDRSLRSGIEGHGVGEIDAVSHLRQEPQCICFNAASAIPRQFDVGTVSTTEWMAVLGGPTRTCCGL
jgi:hypothetical protein